MAIGIAFASTGSMEAHDLLLPLLTDKEGLVKQAAYISLSMVFNNYPKGFFKEEKTFTDYKSSLEKSIKSKSEDPLAKFGALISTGIMNAGGRNSQFRFTSEKTDKTIKSSIVGSILFLQMH